MPAIGLSERLRRGLNTRRYDFIYEDALDHYTIPYQLTTKQFNDKVYQLLTDDGVYMVELIDTFDSGLFLGAFVNTLEQTFPFVYVISQSDVKKFDRSTFVVIAAKHKLNLVDVCRDFQIGKTTWYLNEREIALLRSKAKGMILADNYAPVENLTSPVYLRNVEFRAPKLAERAKNTQRGAICKRH
jgi:spermidine synthase